MSQRRLAVEGASFAVVQRNIPSDPPPIRRQIVQRRKVQAEYTVTPVDTDGVILAGQAVKTDEVIVAVKQLLANTTQVFTAYLVAMTIWGSTEDSEMNVAEHITQLEFSDNNRTKNSVPRVGFEYPTARRLAITSATTSTALADVAVRVPSVTPPVSITVQFLIDLALSDTPAALNRYIDGVPVKRSGELHSLDREMRDLRMAEHLSRPSTIVSPAPSFDIISEPFECSDPSCGINRRHRHRVSVL